MVGDPCVDAILVRDCPTALAERGLVGGKPLLACWLGKHAAAPARIALQKAGIGGFDTPAQAAEAVALLTRWSELRLQLERVPPRHSNSSPDRAAADTVLKRVAVEGRSILTEVEAKAVLRAYGVPVPETVFVSTAEEVETAARHMLTATPAVVVKMLSRTVSHKSDIGGVVLNLADPCAAREAAEAIGKRFGDAFPDTTLDGFTVQPMVRRSHAEELIAGLSTDPTFGPVIVFGAGGTAVEVVDDTATGLVPLDDVLAGDLVDRTRVSRLLAGYRDRLPADRSAIIQTPVPWRSRRSVRRTVRAPPLIWLKVSAPRFE